MFQRSRNTNYYVDDTGNKSIESTIEDKNKNVVNKTMPINYLVQVTSYGLSW